MSDIIDRKKKDLINSLYDLGCIKFGSFKLFSGKESSYYIDLRRVVSDPSVFGMVIDVYLDTMKPLEYDLIAAIPYGALPTAAVLAYQLKVPMIYPRKEYKEYGLQRRIEGIYQERKKVLVIEDVITTGGSVLNGVRTLNEAHLIINDIVILVDREQGGKEAIIKAGYTPHIILTISEIVETLRRLNRILFSLDDLKKDKVKE